MYCEDIMALERHGLENDYLFVYIDTPIEELQDRYNSRGDEHVNFDQIRTIKRRYETFFKDCKLPKIAIDTTQTSWLQDVEAFVREYQRN